MEENPPAIDIPCVGVCLTDADSGYCLGCGRPPAASPEADTDRSGHAAAAKSSATLAGDRPHASSEL